MEAVSDLPDTYYRLNIYLSNVNESIAKKYKLAARRNQSNFMSDNLHDAGIDLYTPTQHNIKSQTHSNKINLGVKCSMQFVNNDRVIPCGYYLYMRSSTGSKTPLRLSNSVGIMDSGYRGEVMACFDNIQKDDNNSGAYLVQEGDRLVQICPPNITYPVILSVVSNESELDCMGMYKNMRGTGGFGSSGR